MNVPCSMCLENPASPKSRCSLDSRKECDCCEECHVACQEEWHNNIEESESEELVRYWNEQ